MRKPQRHSPKRVQEVTVAHRVRFYMGLYIKYGLLLEAKNTDLKISKQSRNKFRTPQVGQYSSLVRSVALMGRSNVEGTNCRYLHPTWRNEICAQYLWQILSRGHVQELVISGIILIWTQGN